MHPNLRHPYYRDDRSLPLIIVITIHGDKEYKVNCKSINGKFYVKGRDLFYNITDDTWTINKKLIMDHELGIEVEDNLNLIKGIVGFENDLEIKGSFSPNPLKNCKLVTEHGLVICIDYALLNPKLYLENYSEGVYYKLNQLRPNDITKLIQKKNIINNINSVYNVDDDKNAFDKAIEIYNKSKFPIDKDLRMVSMYIKDLTFGAELECINGTLPSHLLAKYGVIICKDGSTKDENGHYPPEYVTVPLKGAKGLQTLRNLSAEIAKRSDISIKCSYHLHIGGMPITRVFMVSLYRLCYKIQNDVFKMFPYYKTNPEGVKEKNYCKKLLNNIVSSYGNKNFNDYINDSFTDIYTFLSGGLIMDSNHNIKSKNNPWGQNKWDMKTRYYWVNFINPIFGKHNTIEFRLHTPTLNPDKIINWLLMCSAIIKFAENHTELCIKLNKISFVQVLNFYKDFFNTIHSENLSNNLINYYNNRVTYFEKDIKNNDVTSLKELTEDSIYSFNTTKI